MSDRLEIMWGNELLDEGFTSIPNLVMRNWAKVGVKPAEWAFITVLLTYKHDSRDPYPSQEQLAEDLDCHPTQIKRWIKSLKDKKLIRVGRRRNPASKKWGNNVYSIKPILDAVMELKGQQALPEVVDYEVEWEDEEKLETQNVSMDLQIQNVSMENEQNVSMAREQIVSLKNKRSKTKNKKENNDLSINEAIHNNDLPVAIKTAISRNKKLTDRTIDITSVYEIIKGHKNYSDILFINTMRSAVKQKINISFEEYLAISMHKNMERVGGQNSTSEQRQQEKRDNLPEHIIKQQKRQRERQNDNEKKEESSKEEKRQRVLELMQAKGEEWVPTKKSGVE